MSETASDELDAFVRRVVAQLEKNGFPGRRVSFPIERLYESADAKGLSFNKVLDALAAIGVSHEKTPEKVIFFVTETVPAVPDLGALSGLDPSAFGGLDPAALAGMSPEQLIAAAQAAVARMDPAQLAAMRAMVEGMSPDEQAAMMEQARKLGLG